MTAVQDSPSATPSSKTKSHVRILAVAGLAVLLLVTFAASAIAINAHVHDVYARKDDAYRALAIKTDRDLKAAKTAAAKSQRLAVAAAVKKQRAHDEKKLRHKVAAMKKQKRKDLKASFKNGQQAGYTSGYGAGNSAGYSSGHSDGVDEGLVEGSDQLDCSDDPDVYWLPACY